MKIHNNTAAWNAVPPNGTMSERRFRSLVQNSFDLIAVIRNGLFAYVSPNVRRLLGYEVSFFDDCHSAALIHPEDLSTVAAYHQKVNSSEHTAFPPYRIRHANGSWLWMEATVIDLTADPSVNGIVINARDITERKAKDDQLQQLSLIAQATTNAVIITNLNEEIVWVNKAYTRLTGYSFEEAVGRRPFDLTTGPDSDPAVRERIRKKKSTGQIFQEERINYSKQGRKYWVEIQGQPVHNSQGEMTHYLVINRDITERKQLQEALLKEQKQRQKKITEQVIEAQEKEREEIGRELHDNVNQILTTVKLYIETVLADQEMAPALLPRSMNLIQSSINEIRKLSKELSAPTLGNITLVDSINELIETVTAAKDLKIEFSAENYCGHRLTKNHKLAIYRIIQEQISNTIKYAQATRLTITMEECAKGLLLCLSDNGIGFDPALPRKGIGLHNIITRMEALNGEVQIDSAPGKGVQLRIYLPLETAACDSN